MIQYEIFIPQPQNKLYLSIILSSVYTLYTDQA